MFHKKRSRPVILLTIIGLLFIVPLITACGPIIAVLVSTDTAGTVDGVDFGPEDILAFDGSIWSMYFDGSDYELEQGKHDIEAFSLPISDTLISDTREIYISFYQNKVMVDGLGMVLGQDVTKFTEDELGYSYERFFDGSDVGLSTVGEKIDGLEVFPFDEIVEECAAILFISTLGAYSIPAKFTDGAGKLTGDGSDVLIFCATNVGADTAGFWFGEFFDGQEEGMPKNYLDSLAFLFEGIGFTTPGAFAVDAAFGGHSEVYGFDGDFFGPEFSAPEEGLTEFVDGLHILSCFDECP